MFRTLSQQPRKLLTQQSSVSISVILSSPYSRSSKTKHTDASSINRQPSSPPRLFVVQPRLKPETLLQAKLSEALCLANSLEEQRDGFFDTDFFHKGMPPHVLVQNPRSVKPRADTYFGPGTVDNIKCHLGNVESKGEVDAVFVNAILSGIQQRNLERVWEKPVLDRVGLIIEIFNAHAFTKEAKLQAELAALMYKKTRLVRIRGPDGRLSFGTFGEAEVVSARGRASGGRGFISGAGETELQLQRRRIIDRRNHLLSQIEEVRRTRALQRAARKRRGGLDGQRLDTVAVVGYTNAGKSTLVGALSGSDLYSDDRLFATVDPRLRSVILPSGTKVLLSDTVGFISDLPVQLVEAFHATLEEVVEADLLVHVVDSTAPNLDEHRSTVIQVLKQLGVSKDKLENMIEVWNKIDYEEEKTDSSGYLDFSEGSNIPEEEDDYASGFSGAADEDEESKKLGDVIVSELLPEDTEWLKSDDQHDISDDCLLPISNHETADDKGDSCLGSKSTVDQQSKPVSDGMLKEPNTDVPSGPHLKTSAITGVGLRELLELIDERLQKQDQKLKAEIVERNVFGRKWRPVPRNDENICT